MKWPDLSVQSLNGLVVFIVKGLTLLSRNNRRRIAFGLGYLIFSLSPKTRKRASVNLARAMPELADSDVKNLALRAYQHTVFGVFECFWLEQLDYRIACDELTADYLRSDQGAVIATLHMNCYELVPFVVQQQTGRSTTISNVPDHLGVALDVYQRAGIHCINKRHPLAFFKLIDAVRSGEAVCLHVDHYAQDVAVEFFGQKTLAPSGAALLSSIGNVPLILGHAVLKPDGTYLVTFKLIDKLESVCKEKVERLTQQVYYQFEEIISQHPEQWYWSYNRWR